MKNRLKKAVSLLMTLAIVCSFAVLPASAATAGSNVEIKVEAGDWTGARGSEECEVTVWAEADEEFTLANATFALSFNKDLMTCADADVVANSAFANSTLNANGTAGVTCAIAAAGTNVVSSTNGRVDLLTATFHIKSADSEKQTSKFEIVATSNGVLSAGSTDSEYNEISHTVTGGETSTVVPGTEPALNSVTLAKDSIAAFNGVAETIQARATGGIANVDVTAMVAWSVTPADKGVTIDAETGLISVAKNAQSATYTVTATPVAGQTSGTAKTATLTITRVEAVVTTVTVSGPGTITVPKTAETPNSTAEYTAVVENQFGEAMAGQTVTWTVSSAAGVSISDNVVTVAYGAVKDTEITVTAACGAKNGTKTVRLVDIVVTPVTKSSPVYGDKWSDIVTGVTAKVGEDNVPGTFTVADAGVMPGAGEGRATSVTFKSTDGVYEVTVSVTVNVAKRPITITLPAQKVSYDGEEHTSGNVEYTGDEVVDGATLTCVPVEPVSQTDAGTYKVSYTCESENYTVTVKGGDFVIEKAEVPADKVSQKPLEDFTLYDDVDVSVTKDSSGNVTRISVRIPRNSAKEDEIAKDLADANKRIVLTVEDGDGTKYEFTIKSWKLKEGTTFNSTGSNIFVPDELEGKTDEATTYLKNYAPVLPEFEVRMTASANGGGAGGGSSSGVWGDRGNQTINLTPASIFTDVPDGYTFQTDIMWVYYRGVMKGTSATTFSPTSNTNRQQLWMVLGRLSGSNPGDMATARAWAINTGVSDGSNATGSLTRQQMVTMLYRWAQSKGYTGVTTGSISGYADASSVAGYARDAMAWAVGNGIIHGSGNTLMPNGTATRAQFAAIMHRFCEKFGV